MSAFYNNFYKVSEKILQAEKTLKLGQNFGYPYLQMVEAFNQLH